MHAAGVGGQVDDQLGEQRQPVGVGHARRPYGHLAEQGDLHRHDRAGHQLGGRDAGRRQRVQLGAGRPLRRGEQLDQRRVLARRQELGRDVEPERAGHELALAGDLPGPRGAQHLAGDHVAGRRGVPDRGQAEQPLLLAGVGGVAMST